MLARLLVSCVALVHLAFVFVLLGFSVALPDRSLTVTVRRQFDDWGPLFRLYRTVENPFAVDMRPMLHRLAWCNATLPLAAVRAPYCDCVSLQHTLYLQAAANASLPVPLPLRESAVVGLVRCLGVRPVWRVWAVWSVNPLVPGLYVLLVSACFMWVAADFAYGFTRWGLWAMAFTVGVVLAVHSFHENGLWAVTIPMVALLVEIVVRPGVAEQSLSRRASACFWWAEYICAPVFALFVSLLHGGRDAFCIIVGVALGSTLGALGLRSFWCTYAYAGTTFARDIHILTGLATAFVGSALLGLAGVYHEPATPVALGGGSVAMLTLTVVISLLQSAPVSQPVRLVLQALVASVRNLTLFVVLLLDAAA